MAKLRDEFDKTLNRKKWHKKRVMFWQRLKEQFDVIESLHGRQAAQNWLALEEEKHPERMQYPKKHW